MCQISINFYFEPCKSIYYNALQVLDILMKIAYI